MVAEPDDATLLRGIAARDGAAGDAFARRHAGRVWRYLRARVGPESAEDAVQDAFVAVLNHAHTFRGEGSAVAWVLTVARHAAFRAGRRRSGEPAAPEPLDALGLAAGWGDPERAAIDGEARDALRSALSRLSDDDREVVWLRDVEGLSGAEAADVVGVPLAAFKTRLHRARLRLLGMVSNPEGGSHASE